MPVGGPRLPVLPIRQCLWSQHVVAVSVWLQPTVPVVAACVWSQRVVAVLEVTSKAFPQAQLLLRTQQAAIGEHTAGRWLGRLRPEPVASQRLQVLWAKKLCSAGPGPSR